MYEEILEQEAREQFQAQGLLEDEIENLLEMMRDKGMFDSTGSAA